MLLDATEQVGIQESVLIITEDSQNINDEILYFSSEEIPTTTVSLSRLSTNLEDFKNSLLLYNQSKMSFDGKRVIRDLHVQGILSLIPYTFEDEEKGASVNDIFSLCLPLNKRKFYQHTKALVELNRERRIREELEQYIQSSSRLVSLGELTGAVIHDLNNYMTVCMASYSGIDTAIEKKLGDAKVRKFMGLGKRAVDEIIRISQRCDSFIKGDQTIVMESFQLYELCSWVGDLMEFQLRQAKIDYRIRINRSINLNTDRSVLMQSILNMVKNSIRAIESCDGERWIEVSFENDLHEPKIKVTDSGSIDFASMNRVFDLNFTSNDGDGHGLGLYLVKKNLAELNISIEVGNNGNTQFSMTLPKSIISLGM